MHEEWKFFLIRRWSSTLLLQVFSSACVGNFTHGFEAFSLYECEGEGVIWKLLVHFVLISLNLGGRIWGENRLEPYKTWPQGHLYIHIIFRVKNFFNLQVMPIQKFDRGQLECSCKHSQKETIQHSFCKNWHHFNIV